MEKRRFQIAWTRKISLPWGRRCLRQGFMDWRLTLSSWASAFSPTTSKCWRHWCVSPHLPFDATFQAVSWAPDFSSTLVDPGLTCLWQRPAPPHPALPAGSTYPSSLSVTPTLGSRVLHKHLLSEEIKALQLGKTSDVGWFPEGPLHKPWPRCGPEAAEHSRHKIKQRKNSLWDKARLQGQGSTERRAQIKREGHWAIALWLLYSF